ncbi:peroxiredoxin family protein [Halobacillus litoralis]|uniref:peroxiredoxin family protein n=1 Tax=Halobacillus litoralis TaxID=45668 RepID=UPI00249151EB|nr:peroxiredoxin family protein [Halobacillus litoralis]
MYDLQLGDQVPNFKLPTISKETYSFEEQKNNHITAWHLIVFFRGSWCPYCIKNLKDIGNHMETFRKMDIRVTAIAAENQKTLKQMAEHESLSFPVLVDEFFTVLDAFGVFTHKTGAPYEDHGAHGEPAYFLINEEGKLMYQQKQTGPFGRPSPLDLSATAQLIKKHLKNLPEE